MELFELHNKIIHNDIPKFLVFTGSDYAVKELYIKTICDKLKYNVVNVDDASTVVAANKSISLVGTNTIYVCRYDMKFITLEKYWTNIFNRLKNNYLILVYASIDKRAKFGKALSKFIVNFEPQTTDNLLLMLKSIVADRLTENNQRVLAEGCSNNYGRCLIEIDKIDAYSQIHNINWNQSFKQLVESNIIVLDNNMTVFPFINKVIERNKSCYELYQQLKENGESNISIVNWLYQCFRQQLIVETINGPTPANTGMTQYMINQCKARARRYSVNEMLSILNTIEYVEHGIKDGLIDESMSVDYVMAQVM